MAIKEYGEFYPTSGDCMDMDCDAPDSLYEEYLEYLFYQSNDGKYYFNNDDDDEYYDRYYWDNDDDDEDAWKD